MMVTTVTLNPALDYHITLPGLAPGEIQWFSHSSFSPGGKGINVSLLLSSLGVETRALGIAAGFTGREIARLLEERGCPADMVFLEEGCSRVECEAPKPPAGRRRPSTARARTSRPRRWPQLLGKLSTLGPEDVLVLSGKPAPGPAGDRLPPAAGGRPPGRRQAGGGHGRGPAAGVAALPSLPHQAQPGELCQLFQAEGPHTPLEAKEYAKELQRMGARNVVVSLGEKGALLLEERGCCLAAAAPGTGCLQRGRGDSLVAGFLYGCQLHGTLEGA